MIHSSSHMTDPPTPQLAFASYDLPFFVTVHWLFFITDNWLVSITLSYLLFLVSLDSPILSVLFQHLAHTHESHGALHAPPVHTKIAHTHTTVPFHRSFDGSQPCTVDHFPFLRHRHHHCLGDLPHGRASHKGLPWPLGRPYQKKKTSRLLFLHQYLAFNASVP